MPNYFTYQGKCYSFRSCPIDHKVAVGDFLAVDMASSEEKGEAARLAHRVSGKLLALWTVEINRHVTPVGRLWCKVLSVEA